MQARGYVVEGWDKVNPYNLLGAQPAAMLPLGPDLAGGTLTSATTSQLDANTGKPWHPDSPLFWFGVVLATTLGLIGAATSVRVGPFRAGVAAGTT